jgi:hypothetical protein
MENKSLFASKTFWLNSLVLVAGIVGYVAGHEVIQDNASLVGILVAVQGGLGIVLRLFTSKPIS